MGSQVDTARLVAAICATLLLAAAACTGAGSGTSGAGRYLRYGYDLNAQFTNTFDNSKSKGDCDQIPMSFVYDSLLRYDPATGQPIPGLADQWQLQGRTLTMHIRPGVRFTDGTPVDAQAVRAALNQNNKNDQLTSLDIISSIDVLDPQTIRINIKDNTGSQLLTAFTGRDGYIMSPKSFATASRHPVGSGPFMFESFTPDKEIRLKKNPSYWEKGTYNFPGIQFTQVGTGPPAVTALKAGSVDLIRMESDGYQTLKNDKRYHVVVQPTTAYLELQFREMFNATKQKTPFANLDVRKAVNYAIDRNKINDLVQSGLGEVASQALPKNSPGYNPDVANAYPYDPARARQLLAQAGYPNGFTFTMAIPGPGIKNMADQGTLIQDMLKAVGITARIKTVLGQDVATQYYIQGGGDAFAAARLASKAIAGVYYDLYGRYQFVAIWEGQQRDDITQLSQEAFASPPDRKAELVREMAKIASDNALDVPIAFFPQLMAYDTSRVGGVVRGQTDICDPPNLAGLVMKGR